MGKLKRIAIDSMLLIYLLEGDSSYQNQILKILDSAEEVYLSAMGYGEILVGFEKTGNKSALLTFHAFVQQHIKLIPFGANEAIQFAKLRAKYGWLKAPDAIHLASAQANQCDAFFSQDEKLKKVQEIKVLSLT